MDFRNIINWTIPEGSVRRVLDSLDRVIWQKDTYTIMDYVSCSAYPTGIIIPINIPKDSTYEIFFDSFYTGNIPTSGQSNTNVTPCGTISSSAGRYYISYPYYSSTTTNCHLFHTLPSGSNYDTNVHPSITYTKLKNRIQLKLTDTNIVGTDTSSQLYSANMSDSTRWTKSRNTDVSGYWGFGILSDENGNPVNNTYGQFIGDIYRCYVKVDDEYIHDFIPARRDRDDVYGLLDVVDNTFYESITSNPFTHTEVPMSTLDMTNITVYIGYSAKVPYSYSPVTTSNKDITISSDSSNVSIINNSVYGVSEGTATIVGIANDGGGATDTCTATVYTVPNSITVSPQRPVIAVDGTVQLLTTVSPSNARYNRLTWRSEDTEIATVDSYGLVTGVSEGSVKVYADIVGYNGLNWHPYQWVEVSNNIIYVSSITLNKQSTTLGVGETETLIATISPSDASNPSVNWSSSNTSIATVNANGVITGVSIGQCIITCSATDGSGVISTCTVNVVPISVTGITLNPNTNRTVSAGDTVAFTATIFPSNATNKNIIINPNCQATLNNNVWSFNYTVPTTPGDYIVTVTTADGNYQDNCKLTIPTSTVSVTGVIVTPSTLLLDRSKNDSAQLTFTISPSNATNKNVYWQSSDDNIASVDENGLVTAERYSGTTIITCTTESGGYEDDCEVTVITSVTGVELNKSSDTMYVGDTLTLTASVKPGDCDNGHIGRWFSSNPSIASINYTDHSATVTAISSGTCTIYACSDEDDTIRGACVITVTNPEPTTYNLSNNTGGVIYFTGYQDASTAVELNPGAMIQVNVANSLYVRNFDSNGIDVYLTNTEYGISTVEFGGYTWYSVPANVISSGITITAYN